MVGSVLAEVMRKGMTGRIERHRELQPLRRNSTEMRVTHLPQDEV
jgi:hypothetical protein